MNRLLIASLTLAALLAAAPALLAQGTATSPSTAHSIVFGPPHTVDIGNAANPMPIDLDPNGGPWRKALDLLPGLTILPGDVLIVTETILNVGTEPWTDWHEFTLPGPNGGPAGAWISAQLEINGNPAAAAIGGLGTENIWFDPIVPSVLPGDVLEISKQFQFNQQIDSSQGAALEILQYPTPEPSSAALLGLAGVALLSRYRRPVHAVRNDH